MHPTARRFLAFFLPSLAVATVAVLMLAVAVQQDLRQGADDPQHQIAEDAVAHLDAGQPPQATATGTTVAMATSLDPFLAIYDPAGTVLATNGQLDGQAPAPPIGVLTTAREMGIDTVTWQPRPGVRIALVVLPWTGGTVLAGRSLRRVEAIESAIEGIVVAGWLAALLAVAAASLGAAWLWPTNRRASPPPSP